MHNIELIIEQGLVIQTSLTCLSDVLDRAAWDHSWPPMPVANCRGNSNDSHLSVEERRLIKRRVANRESARRIRQKKLRSIEGLQLQVRLFDVTAGATHASVCTCKPRSNSADIWPLVGNPFKLY